MHFVLRNRPSKKKTKVSRTEKLMMSSYPLKQRIPKRRETSNGEEKKWKKVKKKNKGKKLYLPHSQRNEKEEKKGKKKGRREWKRNSRNN